MKKLPVDRQTTMEMLVAIRAAHDSSFAHSLHRWKANIGAVNNSVDSRQQRRARERAEQKKR